MSRWYLSQFREEKQAILKRMEQIDKHLEQIVEAESMGPQEIAFAKELLYDCKDIGLRLQYYV